MMVNFSQSLLSTEQYNDASMILPQPQKVEIDSSHRRVHLFSAIVADRFSQAMDDAASQVVSFLIDEVITTVSKRTGVLWHRGTPESAEKSQTALIELRRDNALEKTAYKITIAKDADVAPRIILAASSVSGLRAAVQTLRQLIRDNGLSLPVLTIWDKPSYTTRAYVLDVTRGRVPTLAWLFHWVDLLELSGYNQLQLYVEDVFAFIGFEQEWWNRSPLTAQDIRSLDAYCVERGIELVPCLSTFGHLYTLLRTEQFAQFSEFPEDAKRPFSFIERQEHHTLNIDYPNAFALVASRLAQFMPLFSSRKFNICGDETFDLGKGASRVNAKQEGVHRMYARFVSRLTTYLTDRGYQPLMWGDVVLQRPSVVQEIAGNPIYLNWQYAPLVTDNSVKTLAQQGVEQWVCSATHTWNTLFPLIDDTWNNSARLAIFGVENGCDGFVLTDWGDYGHVNDPHLAVPALLIGAECAWNARRWSQTCRTQIINADDPETKLDHISVLLRSIKSRISHILFRGDESFLELLTDKGNTPAVFSWGDLIRYKELDDGLGRVNSDVAQSMTWIYPQYEQIPQAETLAQARAIFFEPLKRRIERSAENRRAVIEVEELLAHTPLDAEMEQALLITATGQDLLDEFARTMIRKPEIRSVDHVALLCAQLQDWYQQYQTLWFTTSRQGQIEAIHEVVAFMVTILNDMVKEK